MLPETAITVFPVIIEGTAEIVDPYPGVSP
jgi:hypothetical protein